MKKISAVLGVGLAALTSIAHAEYPERAVNMVIPYGAGGATDISARTIAEPLGAAVGKPLVMVNVTGAGGATGSVNVQNAKADGYTMLFARVGSHSVNPAMKATLPKRRWGELQLLRGRFASAPGWRHGVERIRCGESPGSSGSYPTKRWWCCRHCSTQWNRYLPLHQLFRTGQFCG